MMLLLATLNAGVAVTNGLLNLNGANFKMTRMSRYLNATRGHRRQRLTALAGFKILVPAWAREAGPAARRAKKSPTRRTVT